MRRWDWIRGMVQETQLSASNLIWPIFVIEGQNRSEPIASMPGVERMSVDRAVAAAERAAELGIGAVAIFPVTPSEKKTDRGDEALVAENLMCTATRAIRAKCHDSLGIVCDVALDPYTTHGHDGIMVDNYIVND